MKLGPIGVTVLALFALVLSGADCQIGPIGPCAPEIFPTARVQLRLLEPYSPDGTYVWDPLPGYESWASCEGRDGLVVGRYDFLAEDRSGGGLGCIATILLPLTPIGDVDVVLDRVRPLGGLASTSASYDGGAWELVVLSLTRDGTPFGVPAVPGRAPPVRVTRRIVSEARSCHDEWAGEIVILPATFTDAGPG